MDVRRSTLSGPRPSPSAIRATSAAASSGRVDRVAMALNTSHWRRHGKGKRRGRSDAGVIKIQTLGNEICPFPERLLIKLPFDKQFNAVQAAAPGTPIFGTFKLNSIYHPDGVTTQNVSWWTAVSALYNFWRVPASTINVDYVGNVSSIDQYCAIWPSATGNTVTTYAPYTVAGLRAFPTAKWAVIESEASLGPRSKVNVTYHVNMLDTFGLQMNGASTGEGAFDSAPGGPADIGSQELYYWVLAYYTSDAAVAPTTGINVEVFLKITYYVECFQLMKPDNMTLTDLEQIQIDSKGAICLAPPEDQPGRVEIIENPPAPILADMSASTFEFIEKLKASMK